MSEKDEELKAKYSDFEEEELEQALPPGRDPFDNLSKVYSAQIIRSGESLPLECPACSLMNPASALICASCGYNFQASTEAEGIDASASTPNESSRISETASRASEKEIERLASSALKYSIYGLLFFVLVIGMILALAAISRASQALLKLKEYPAYATKSHAKGKAIAAFVIGWMVILIYAIGIISLFFRNCTGGTNRYPY